MRCLRTLRLLGAALAVALVALVTVASPTRAYAAESEGNLVKGHADFAQFPAAVTIHASSEPDGDDAHGRFSLTQGGVTVTGKVTCLTIDGGRAIAGGTIVKSTNPKQTVGFGFYQLIAAPDHSQTFFLPAPPTSCPKPTVATFGNGFKATGGHYTVRAAEDEDDD